MVYQAHDLKEVHTFPLDVSPTILVPYYDQDSNTLFVTGKVRQFEISKNLTDFPLCKITVVKANIIELIFNYLQ